MRFTYYVNYNKCIISRQDDDNLWYFSYVSPGNLQCSSGHPLSDIIRTLQQRFIFNNLEVNLLKITDTGVFL